MDAIADYGSSDDEDIPQIVTTGKLVNEEISKSQSTTENDDKRRSKKLGMLSVVPKHIQEALLRGDTTQDSDSDDDAVYVSARTQKSNNSSSSASTSSGPTSKGGAVAALKSLLPTPSIELDPPVAQTSTLNTITDDGNGSSIDPAYDYESAAAAYSQQYFARQQHTSHIEHMDTDKGMHVNTNASANAKRKRTRDAEGRDDNFSDQNPISDTTGTGIQQVHGAGGNWDATAYNIQRAKDAEVRDVFSRMGSNGKMLKGIGSGPTGAASRIQKSRHHINSLVSAAVLDERELAEKAAQRGHNRATNRMRYGF